MRPRSVPLRRLSNAEAASTMTAVGAPAGAGENRPDRTLPSVVMPLNGAAASFAQVPNNSCARGDLSRASVCARAVGPEIRDLPGSGMNDLKS